MGIRASPMVCSTIGLRWFVAFVAFLAQALFAIRPHILVSWASAILGHPRPPEMHARVSLQFQSFEPELRFSPGTKESRTKTPS